MTGVRDYTVAELKHNVVGLARAATALGLMLSALVHNQNQLLALVPMALIPQLIFSDVLLPSPSLLVERIELLMLADWSLDALTELPRANPEWLVVARDVAVLSGMGIVFLLVAGLALRAQRE